MRSRLPFFVSLLLALALAAAARAAYETKYTTSPSYTVTLSGLNTAHEDAQWTDGGHVRREAIQQFVPPQQWVRDIQFALHDNTLCDSEAVDHKTARRLKAIQGAGTAGDDRIVRVYRNIKIFVNGVAVQEIGTTQFDMQEDNKVYWQYWSPYDLQDVPSNQTAYFKVGSWQGMPENYVSVASTVDLQVATDPQTDGAARGQSR